MKKDQCVFLVLLFILSAALVFGYFSQITDIHQKETVKALVTEAASFIEDTGENAFPEFRREGSEWFYDDTYVFVWRTDGVRVVYPPDTSGEGQNMSTLIDVTGKAIGRLFIDIALSEEGEDWINYRWPKPGETEPTVKHTYIKGASTNDQVFLVGSGFYEDTNENLMSLLHYSVIAIESLVALMGLVIAVRQKRFFGFGVFLAFALFIFYDWVRLIFPEVTDANLYPILLVATLSALWATIIIYREKQTR